MLDKLPKTLLGVTRFFADPQVCLDFVALMRWGGDEPVCHHCGNVGAYYLATRKIYKCKACRKQFSVKLGTIFEESGITLDKWLVAIWLIANAKNGISSYELGRSIGVTQRTAWFMLQRIRIAMESGTIEKLSGTVEADETWVGGDARKMHAKTRKTRGIGKHSTSHKTLVLGMLSRKGKVKAKVVKDRRINTLQTVIAEHVEAGCELMTDEHHGYWNMRSTYVHNVINHSQAYVRDNIHTNGVENFWSLLKRTIKGTYVSIQAEHLQKYIEEQCFRYNNRETDDRGRFLELVKSVSGKRLTWEKLTGYQI